VTRKILYGKKDRMKRLNREKQKDKVRKISPVSLSLYFPVTRHLSLVTLLASLLLLIFPNQGSPERNLNFKPALPGWKYEFPRDHRVHREFKTEWWYYNGHLKGPEGRRYGFQVTFFRVGLIPGPMPKEGSRWQIRDVVMAHLAVTDIHNETFLYHEKAGRANLGLAGTDTDRYRVWVENWQVIEEGKRHRIQAGDGDLSLSLNLTPTGPPRIHGLNGIIKKGNGAGQAAHYYSITRMDTQGLINIRGKQIPVTGLSWMDHEFGSNQFRETQAGWDWFSLHLDNGMDLMIYQIRHEDGRVDPNSSGTLIGLESRKIHLSLSDIKLRVLNFWKSFRSGATYPASWEIQLPQHDIRLELAPLMADQELMTPKSTGITYWEGIVKVTGTYQGRRVKGEGYVEMTGYDQRYRPKI
jgi:predicted secreted hydrolase